jgi:pimeloyl-ACP methyl ester carboxylesterase
MRYFLFLSLLILTQTTIGQTDSLLDFQLKVPVDYSNPKLGLTTIYYELGDIFLVKKPTVFIISDAQQFYVKKGSVKQLQNSLFDSTFNVVGIIGRNNNDVLKNSVIDYKGNINWTYAYNIFTWQQYVNDIDAVRKKLLGRNGRINLYGQSGGGLLAHQYLSVYGKFVDKAFTGAAVNYSLDNESGINHDKFWEETCDQDSTFPIRFSQLINKNYFPRDLIAMLFQRQNFFVKPDSLVYERNKLLNLLLMNDTASLNDYKIKYQIKDILSFYDSPDGIPIKVRLFEFILPLLKNFKIETYKLRPNIENLYFSSLPLIEVFNKNQIKPIQINLKHLHLLETDVFILSGRWDHTADYRSQIALASIYRNHYLFIANDNHTFISLKNDGLYNKLLIAFLKYGKQDILFANVIRNCESYRWTE